MLGALALLPEHAAVRRECLAKWGVRTIPPEEWKCSLEQALRLG